MIKKKGRKKREKKRGREKIEKEKERYTIDSSLSPLIRNPSHAHVIGAVMTLTDSLGPPILSVT